ncbi:MAG: hypothetical protein FWG73_00570 [Planctomycetaceae bacterium]|nr:hypothetical protein [Planctomycetaceae bacterium]
MRRTVKHIAVLTAALLVSLAPAFCQGQAISPEKAMVMGFVENYFQHNEGFTMRKSLEWGEVQADAEGNSTILYTFEGLQDGNTVRQTVDFTFNKDGSVRNVSDLSEEAKKLVVGYFEHHGFDVTTFKNASLEVTKRDDGTLVVDYWHDLDVPVWSRDVWARTQSRYRVRHRFEIKEGKIVSSEHPTEFVQLTGNPAPPSVESEPVVSIEAESVEGIYSMPVSRDQFAYILNRIQRLLPEISFKSDRIHPSNRYSVIVTGIPADHDKVAKAIAQAQEEVNEEITLVVYPLQVTPYVVSTIIQPNFLGTPGFKMAMGGESNNLLFVLGRPIDHKRLKEALQTLEEASSEMRKIDEDGPHIFAYSLTEVKGNIHTLIGELFPDLQLAWCSDRNMLFVSGSLSDLENVSRILAYLE